MPHSEVGKNTLRYHQVVFLNLHVCSVIPLEIYVLILSKRVHLLELKSVGFHDRREIFEISGIGKFVDNADEIRCVIDDVPGDCRPDESGSAGYDDAIHELSSYLK